MNRRPAVGTGLEFIDGFGEFLAGRLYAIVALRMEQFLLVEIDLMNMRAARQLRFLDQKIYQSLESQGRVAVCDLPSIPKRKSTQSPENGTPPIEQPKRIAWAKELQPMADAATEIFSAPCPVRKFNAMARAANLHISRSRERFFLLAAYGFDDECLAPADWKKGKLSLHTDQPDTASIKRGRPVKDPTITFVGWAYDPTWEKPMLKGWHEHARPGKTYASVYVNTLRTEFGCISDKTSRPARIYHPKGKTYPTRWQFKNFIIKTFGEEAWLVAKYGEQTIRNRAGISVDKVSQYLVNLLEEVQWDAQILAERPGDLLDPSQPGKPIVRVVAICATCGGPVGVGYDYGAESQWAYLMALLCMAMKKSEFGTLFGVDISDEDWPAIGVMLAIRGDRGPAIGRKVSDIVGDVLKIWQEWAASYDPVGKANAESGHYKTVKVEGAPRTPQTYRTPMEIIRDDLRKTVAKFRSADMSHRLDPEQGKRLTMGTPLTIWNDLAKRSLYAGQHVPLHKLIRLAVPRHPVSIRNDGVYLGGVRYLSPELIHSGILERARGHAIAAHVYALHMAIRCVWLDLNGELLPLTGVPVRINAMDATHSMTLEESMLYLEQINRSRRAAEQEQIALELDNKIEAEKDRHAVEKARKERPVRKSTGKRETIQQHDQVLRRKT